MLNANVAMNDYNGNTVTIPVFQLLQWKHAIGLEILGLKMSRGSVTAHVRQKLSIPRNWSRTDIKAHLTGVLDNVQEQAELESLKATNGARGIEVTNYHG